ncbi:MAG: RDD family protein [Burkholderiaceae bacterium]|jgi:uncharacterized RDD family membrane protein YckC
MSQDSNPYRPPLAEVELASEAVEGRPVAGKGRRFATLLIDYIGFYALSLTIGIVLGIVFGSSALKYMQGGWSYVFGVVIVSAYYLFFEGLWSRTPGKMVLGTIVTDMNGGTPTFGAIAKRTLARIVPFEAFTFFGERGFHDKASRTQVLYKR